MISNLILSKRINNDILNFIGNQIYIIQDKKRKFINTLGDLKAIMRESSFAIRKEDKGTTKGLLFVWEYTTFNNTRNYVKIAYETITDADDLLMVLNWNFNKEVYVKLEKNSPIIDSFRKKGFKRCHDTDNEVLLCRSKNDKQFFPPYKEGDNEED